MILKLGELTAKKNTKAWGLITKMKERQCKHMPGSASLWDFHAAQRQRTGHKQKMCSSFLAGKWHTYREATAENAQE
jgi:hypothetical protein